MSQICIHPGEGPLGAAATQIHDVMVNPEPDDDGRTLVLSADVGVPPRRRKVGNEFKKEAFSSSTFCTGKPRALQSA